MRSFFASSVSFLLMVTLTSCSMFSYKNTEDLQSTPCTNVSISEAVESKIVAIGDWPDVQWWKVFHSEQLSDFIELALKQNPEIKKAEAIIEKARQITIQRRSKLFPWVFADASDEWIYLSENGLYHTLNPDLPLHANLLNIGLGINYEVDIWSKYRNLYKASMGEAFAEKARAKQVKLMISTAVAHAYFGLKINLIKKTLFENLYELQLKLVALQDLLAESGLSSNLPVYLAKEYLEEAEQAVLSIDEEILINKHTLNTLLGRGADDNLCITAELDNLPEKLEIPETLSIDLLSRRPDLMASIWQVTSLGHTVGAKVAEFFPDINLKGFIGFQSLSFSNIFDWASKTAALIPAIHLPIFNAGNIQAGVDGAKAEYKAAVFAYNDLVLGAVKEVADTLISVTTVYQKKKSQDRLLQFASARLALKELRMTKGIENALEIYREAKRVVMNELKAVSLLYGQYFFSIQLIKSLGGGYHVEEDLPLEVKTQDDCACYDLPTLKREEDHGK